MLVLYIFGNNVNDKIGHIVYLDMPLAGAFFFSSRRRHTRFDCDWSSDVCSSDLQGEIADEQGHAQMLADKIAALGGDPTTQARPVQDTDDPREMLENALVAEKQRSEERRVGKEGRSPWAPYH